jgi:hypothetical protein
MALAFVQSKSANGASASPAVTLNSAPISGHLLVAAIASSGETITITGWTALTIASQSGPVAVDYSIRLFYKKSDGSETTVTGSTENVGWTMAVAEYSGVDTTTQLDVENSQLTASGTTHTTPTVTPTSSVERLLVFATTANAGSRTWSTEQVNGSATGVNEREDNTQSATTLQLSDLIITSTSGSYNAVATVSGAAAVGAAAIAMFKSSGVSDDTVTVSDSSTATDTLNGYSDTVFIRESLAFFFPDVHVSVSDTTTVVESYGPVGTDIAVINDSTTVTDSITLLDELNRRVSDTSNVQDPTQVAPEDNPNVSEDSISINDAFALLQTSFINLSELTAVTDTPNAVIPVEDTYNILVQDSSIITENVVVATDSLQVNVSDSQGVTDAVSLQLDLGDIAVTDPTTVTEFVFGVRDWAAVTSDSVSITDTVNLLNEYNINVSETTSIGETLGEENTEYFVVNDTSSITESVVLNIDELFITVSDSTTVSESTQQLLVSDVSVSESSTITELNVELVPLLFITTSDSSGVTESSVVVIPAAGVLSVVAVESTQVTDSVSVRVSDPQINVSDSSTVTESTVLNISYSINVNNTSAVTDSKTVLIPTLNVNVSNTSTVTDSKTVFQPFLAVKVSDTTTITELVTTPQNPRANIAETVTITESVQLLLRTPFVKPINLVLDVINTLDVSLDVPAAINMTLAIEPINLTLVVPDPINITLTNE